MQVNKILFALFLLLGVIACKDDDDLPRTPLTYDATQHIYGASFFTGNGNWELVIDPTTGQFDSIPGTGRPGGGVSIPNGTTRLTSFANNQRIFIDPQNGQTLVIQDLDTLAYSTINLQNPADNDLVVNPQFIFFGRSEDEVFILDTGDSLWSVQLSTGTVERIYDVLLSGSTGTIANIFYLPASDRFLIARDEVLTNAAIAVELLLFDNAARDIVTSIPVTSSFGYVQHPSNGNIYFLSTPTAHAGFRLQRVTVVDDDILVNAVSTDDLAIDELSFYMQTIHTATNTYICRGGSTAIGAEVNTLYAIDLSLGTLVTQSTLDRSGVLLNLSGE